MTSKLDVTLTDFIYAIVVGAAFQRIDAPVFSIQNLLLLIAFIVIVDDWVLYHVQAEKVPGSSVTFAKSLIIDAGVLLTWYCAAVSGSHGDQGSYPYLRDFLLFLGCFYVLTLAWEIAFKGLVNNSGRIIPDLICVAIIAAALVIHQKPYFPIAAALFTLPWFAARLYAWRRIVFVVEPPVPADRQPASLPTVG